MLVQNGETIDARMVYDQFETDLLNEESTGVKKMFSMICPLIDIMRNGKVLLCDELKPIFTNLSYTNWSRLSRVLKSMSRRS